MDTVAYLSDGLRNATTTSTVLYIEMPKAVEEGNTAPYFTVSVSDEYIRLRSENSTDAVAPIVLGQAYDNQNDTFVQKFECVTCGTEELAWFSYDETSG